MTEQPELSAHELLTTTRAVRKRLDLDRPVPRTLVEECVEIALQAPSGGNRRAYRFVVVEDAEQRAAVAKLYRKAFELYRVGPTVATKAFEGDAERTSVQNRVFDSVEHLAVNLHRVPMLVIPCMAGRAEEKDSIRGQAGFYGSVFPAVWSFQLAARQRGLGTALTTMHLEFEEEMAQVLDIPHDRYTQVALLPLAFTIGTNFRKAEREDANEFLHWDRWGDD